MKKIIQIAAVVALGASASFVTGCASIVNGTQQSVSVKTGEVRGANCELSNNKGTWYVSNTPGSVVVHRSFQDLEVSCQKKGYHNKVKKIGSSTKPMAFGNVVFGGVIGAGVDVANGAAYDYPVEINLPLSKVEKG